MSHYNSPIEHNPYLNATGQRLNARYGRIEVGLTDAGWIVKYTMIKGRRYSFVDHEFQEAIANDNSEEIVVIKCAQVGLSEIMLRKVLAFLLRYQGTTVILTQPTRSDALKFSGTRIDDAISHCELASHMIDNSLDSKELKKLGQSYWYIKGTIGAKAAISVPADVLVHDELDFSDLEIINKYASRIQHSKYKHFRKFSTPTIPGFGIHKEFSSSDQKYQLQRCPHCGHWTMPPLTPEEFFTRIAITHKDYKNAEKSTLTEDDLAYMTNNDVTWLCDGCNKPVRYHDFTEREYVALYPGRAKSGYHVSPYNNPFQSPYELLKLMTKYSYYADWVNFSLGLAYIDSEMMFDIDKLEFTGLGMPYGTFVGVDYGKKCYIIVADFQPGLAIIHEAIEVYESDLEGKLDQIKDNYGVLHFCGDALPQTKLSLECAAMFTGHVVYYSDTQKEFFGTNEEETIATVNRTQLYDKILGLPKVVVNSKIDRLLLQTHLKGMVKQRDKDDEHKHRYVKVGPDHFLHAFGYAYLAWEIFGGGISHVVMPDITTVTMKTEGDK